MSTVAFVMSAAFGSLMDTEEFVPGALKENAAVAFPSENCRTVAFQPCAGVGSMEAHGSRSAQTRTATAALFGKSVSPGQNTRTRI